MWLVGMMGSGKTSVGRLTAELLGVPFYDTDEAVAALAGASIPEIWDTRGEDGFRQLETDAIAGAPPGVVAAAGGGAVLDSRNREMMRARPPVIWLRSRPETLARRVGSSTDRPLLTAAPIENLTQILNERETAYEQTATHIIDTDDRDVDDIAGEVSGLWPD